MSDETYRILGLSPQKDPIDIAIVREMMRPDDREAVFRKADEAIRSGTRADFEHRVRPMVQFVNGLKSLSKFTASTR